MVRKVNPSWNSVLLQKAKPSCKANPEGTACETCEMIPLFDSLSWDIAQIWGAAAERSGLTGQFDASAVRRIAVKLKSEGKIA